MKKFKKWLEKRGIDNYKTETFGNNYFYNIPCPKYKAFHFCFELTNDREATQKNLETIEKIKRHCKRYGYDFYNQDSIFGYPSYIFFYVANRSEREKAADYFRFTKMSQDECLDLRHKKGLYPGINEDMKKIMLEYEQIYIDFLKALNQAA